MLSARSPKYPGLHDAESGVRFDLDLRPVEVTEEQALLLAERRYVDGILIGEFDEDGRSVNERPAKDWAKDRRRGENASAVGGESGADPNEVKSDEATTVAPKNTRSK